LWRGAAFFARLADAQPHENALERAEAGKGSLKKIETDKGREEQPEVVYPMSKRESRENKRAGDKIDNVLPFHISVRISMSFV
jgi:hypothetical protein